MISDQLSVVNNYYQAPAIDFPLCCDKEQWQWEDEKEREEDRRADHYYTSISPLHPKNKQERKNPAPTWREIADIIQPHQITILPKLLVQLIEHNCISFTIMGEPLASLNHNVKRYKDPQGPYMDIFSYSFRPVTNENAYIPLSDSAGGTPVEKMQQITQENVSVGMNINAMAGYQGSVNNLGNIGPGLNAAIARSNSCQTEESAIQQKLHVTGEKRTLIFSLNKCKEGDKFVPYNAEKMLTSLYTYSFVFGNSINTPPNFATSSFGGNWTVKYSICDQNKAQFEWTTEVRTVIASSTRQFKKMAKSALFTIENFTWIRTTHQVTQLFEVNINRAEKKLSTQLISKSVQRIIVYGVNDNTVQKRVIVDKEGKERIISEEEACKQFNIST